MFKRRDPDNPPTDEELKSRLTRNTTLCLLAGLFLMYQMYNAFKSEEEMPWWFLAINAVLVLILFYLLWRNWRARRRLEQKMEEEGKVESPKPPVVKEKPVDPRIALFEKDDMGDDLDDEPDDEPDDELDDEPDQPE